MNEALCAAAKAGVDVRIITPHIPDKRRVFELTRAHYEPLVKAGVKVYEYLPGFIHSKTLVCDDQLGMVGTINLDYRSLYLHFECGVWLSGAHSVADIKRDFLETQEKCDQVTLEEVQGQSWAKRDAIGACCVCSRRCCDAIKKGFLRENQKTHRSLERCVFVWLGFLMLAFRLQLGEAILSILP